jgi:hypothetical protein
LGQHPQYSLGIPCCPGPREYGVTLRAWLTPDFGCLVGRVLGGLCGAGASFSEKEVASRGLALFMYS